MATAHTVNGVIVVFNAPTDQAYSINGVLFSLEQYIALANRMGLFKIGKSGISISSGILRIGKK